MEEDGKDKGRDAVEAALDPVGQKTRRRNLTALAFPRLATRTIHTALHYIALQCTIPHCTTLHYTALYLTALHCTTLL